MLVNTIHFTSGLGNQLYQFFFGESLKIKFPEIQINYNDSILDPYQLKITDIFHSSNKPLFKVNNNKNLTDYYKLSFFRLVIKLNINKFFNIYSDNTMVKKTFSSISVNNIKHFHGYWQNYNYFNSNFELIKKKLTFKEKVYLRDYDEVKNYSEIIGVHFRGGDYKKNENIKIFHQVDENYYTKNINKILKLFKNPIFLFFTDDYFHLKKTIKNFDYPHIFINEISPNRMRDFQLLSQCDHFLIPNSTFSLWAAIMNKQNKKIVVTPKNWFKHNKFNFKPFDQNWFLSI